MVTLIVHNRDTFVRDPSAKVVRVLEKVCSYRVQGFQFSPAWRAKIWDGKEHLLRFSKAQGYSLPTGLAVTVARRLKTLGVPFRVVDKTRVRHKRTPLRFCGHDLRAYQREAKCEILRSPFAGRGIIKMPVRSGKTVTAGSIIARIGLPALFGVPSLGLLHQTHREFQSFFPDIEIGLIGDSIYQPGFITVATMHTLLNWRGRRADKKKKKEAVPRDPRYDLAMKSYDVCFFDEVHRLKGQGSWHEVAYELNAKYKMGLSATAFLKNEDEQSKGAIWMIATCGPIRIDIPVSRLVDEGFLMRQNVDIYRVVAPDFNGAGWSTKMRQRCIDENTRRNKLIARLAKQHSDAGLRVLVIARHKLHIALIHEELENLGLTVAVVMGHTSTTRRNQAAEDLADKSVDVVVSNVFGEGIDLPSVEVVINAEGGKGDIQTVQRQRNLTISAGKKKAILIDFLDLTNETLREHSEARLAMYKSESSFKVRLH